MTNLLQTANTEKLFTCYEGPVKIDCTPIYSSGMRGADRYSFIDKKYDIRSTIYNFALRYQAKKVPSLFELEEFIWEVGNLSEVKVKDEEGYTLRAILYDMLEKSVKYSDYDKRKTAKVRREIEGKIREFILNYEHFTEEALSTKYNEISEIFYDYHLEIERKYAYKNKNVYFPIENFVKSVVTFAVALRELSTLCPADLYVYNSEKCEEFIIKVFKEIDNIR